MRDAIGRVGRKHLLLFSTLFIPFTLILIASTASAPAPDSQQSVLGIESSSHPGLNKSSKTDNDNSTNSMFSVPASSNIIKLPPMHKGLNLSTVAQLRKLAAYEQIAGGAVASRMMIFTDIPADSSKAVSAGADIAATLKEFSRFSIKPLVIMEPVINGHPVNFKNYRAGSYDGILDKYFESIKNRGVSNDSMGMWVYFPEANLPEWGPVDVADYSANVSRTVQIQKKYFSKSQSSILLDAMSYPAGSTNWDEGSYVSLSPFIKNIPKGLLDSVGMQGFPWVPPANQKGYANLEPANFLNNNLAKAAATQLGANHIWLNTGTFAAAYTDSKSQTVEMTASQRQKILAGISQEAQTLKKAGYSVSVNLFIEDKSDTGEAIDWSYKLKPDQDVLVWFIKQLFSAGNDFWLFDA